jgi:hypothetical protein
MGGSGWVSASPSNERRIDSVTWWTTTGSLRESPSNSNLRSRVSNTNSFSFTP